MNKTVNGPNGVVLVLDRDKVVLDDPGADTPAMVYYKRGSATYWCACGEGEEHKSYSRTIIYTGLGKNGGFAVTVTDNTVDLELDRLYRHYWEPPPLHTKDH